MTLITTTSILLTFAFMLPLMNTPVTLGVWIFSTALITSMFITLNTSSWFGLILFIIYIGGMLVMFSYFAATAPNQKMNLSSIFGLSILMTSLIMYQLYLSPQIWAPFMNNLSMTAPPMYAYLFSAVQGPLLISMAILLLMALIFVVKITNRNMGPLRPFN